jgi:hypothetical protein
MTTIKPVFKDEPFIANPHALLIDGVVTEVVFMQDYTEEEIKETLLRHTYDEVIRWDDYGYEMHVGYQRLGTWVVLPQPAPEFTFDKVTGTWERPKNPEGNCPPCETHKEESN